MQRPHFGFVCLWCSAWLTQKCTSQLWRIKWPLLCSSSAAIEVILFIVRATAGPMAAETAALAAFMRAVSSKVMWDEDPTVPHMPFNSEVRNKMAAILTASFFIVNDSATYRGEGSVLKPFFYIFVARFIYADLCNYKSSIHMQTHWSNIGAKAEKSMQTPTALCFPISRPILVRRRSEKYIVEGSTYAHWVGLYLSCHLNWIMGPFVRGRLQNLQTSEVTLAHVITPLNAWNYPIRYPCTSTVCFLL